MGGWLVNNELETEIKSATSSFIISGFYKEG
jgi:hypothetical protein